MKVSELAAELEVPASAVIEQCQRFGIDASWAGAELTGTDVVILRAELAGADEALDLTPADAAVAEQAAEELTGDAATSAAAADAGAEAEAESDEDPAGDDEAPDLEAEAEAEADAEAAPDEPTDADAPEPDAEEAAEPVAPVKRVLPPTAVGSMPELIDEVTPEPEPDPDDAPYSRAPGFQMAGTRGSDAVAPNETRSIPPREPPSKRRLDRAARNGLIALIVAVVLFAASNFVGSPAAIAFLWLLTAAALIVAIVDAIRGRRHVQTHPERLTGLVLSVITLIASIAGVIGLTVAVMTVVREVPAEDAPLSMGDLAAVQSARWGYQRVTRLADNGWTRPARDVDTCWGEGRREVRKDSSERTEIPFATNQVDCDEEHTMEVAMVFAVNRDADAPYPDDIEAIAAKRCATVVDKAKANAKGDPITLWPEVPTEKGWDDGDHDVTCMLVFAPRKGELAY